MELIQKWKNRSWKKNVVSGCICFLVLAALITIGLYVILNGSVKERDHKLPDFHVKEFNMSSLDQSLTENRISSQSSFVIETTNRGQHMDIWYDTFMLKLESQSEGISFGNGTVPGFYQASKNTTLIVGNMTSVPAAGETLDAAQQLLLQNAWASQVLHLIITIDVQTRYAYGSRNKQIPQFTAEVSCKLDVNPQTTAGSQLLWESCKVAQFDCLTDICD
ncbi:protein MpLEA-like33 [Marchantia polymorpha subsp. ruderalis]|uniref:Late embryogenesis abundant protein LEA-2 subgroup domain-containing protein n=2 Tax=Marchantia polymorpha TaxID=3197 RepID=A0AAF6BL80_MARPO|nr:hypothetical protein MARPO_0010s0186 [Marchantia polymorpha]BBN12764.1 hypothetical protein Mp_5g22700 [Marchantia polymorpha subsp. ruderalis]|eukprot:PTQ46815.1 hypothetical protein MARPO_0010s0186 [Marchantia polymorpha]